MYTISQPWFCSAPDNYPPCWYPDEYGTYENRTIDDVISNPNNGTIPAFPISLTENECDNDSEVEEEYHVEFYGATALFLFSQFQECFINWKSRIFYFTIFLVIEISDVFDGVQGGWL